MKKMLLVASAVGAGIAGLIVYSKRKTELKSGTRKTLGQKGNNSYGALDTSLDGTGRSALHTMG
jgi:hypothetical protein